MNGKDILHTLVKLLGDQEGVVIRYEIKERKDEEENQKCSA